MHKIKHDQYPENKTSKTVGLTNIGWHGLKQLAQSHRVSVSEFVERVGRGIYPLKQNAQYAPRRGWRGATGSTVVPLAHKALLLRLGHALDDGEISPDAIASLLDRDEPKR